MTDKSGRVKVEVGVGSKTGGEWDKLLVGVRGAEDTCEMCCAV